MPIKRWKLPQTDGDAVKNLARETGYPEIVCAVLHARGIADPAAIEAFLSGSDQLDSPYDMIDMDKAVARIRLALERGEKIAVYGDYDCDGITSTTLLMRYLQSVGADCLYYVPSREKEGYGLNKKAVDSLYGREVGLIVTVDNGISAHEEIAYAATLGIDVVVTDHHTPRDTLPDAAAVVNPHRVDCPSRFKELAGVGVAFKLICALEEADGSELLEYYSDIVALGTIADVMPLVDENRTIVRHGLARIAETDNIGIQALIRVSGLSGRTITGESAAFGIIPRINASGRMGSVDSTIELLLTDDAAFAGDTAERVNTQNSQRKKIEEDILAQIEEQLRSDPTQLAKRLLILCGHGWHHGVVGIVASKLMERYSRPVILISIEESGMARGSGRSLPGFDLIEAITACSGTLTQYGGHTLAAGLSLRGEDIPVFAAEMERWAAVHYPVMPVTEYKVDCALTPQELAIGHIRLLDVLEPFGAANEQPSFLLPAMRIEGIYPTSDGKHVRIRFQFGNHMFYAVYFRMTARELPFSQGDVVDVLAAVTVGEWNNAPQLSVRIKDIRPCGLDQERAILEEARYRNHLRGEYGGDCDKEAIVPNRGEIAVVYRYIRKSGGCAHGADGIYYNLLDSGLDYCKIRIALDVLREMELVEETESGISVREGAPKVELQNSAILAALKG
ncbi:single-stranded-DNA-specific exonuclease RecJ [Ruminococcaceae bacterium OttesenSCG-928-L11]|nr:single-stranded-DNA-specific exonuclease RecJ [Ruminococcaceae bacterium OttesenSCG-928-L11]